MVFFEGFPRARVIITVKLTYFKITKARLKRSCSGIHRPQRRDWMATVGGSDYGGGGD